MRHILYRTEDGQLDVEFLNGQPYLHLSLNNWSVSKYKQYKRTLSILKEALKEMGYSHMYVGIPDNDPKLLKFEQMFGFEIIEHASGAYLLRQEV